MMTPGTVIGERFRIVRTLGSGGMGVVYEAMDLKLDRKVALKCARPGHHYRLPPEARAAREVSHFNVCKVHELHTLASPDGEIDCLSMEFVEGETLSKRIRAAGKIDTIAALDLAEQICAGVDQAHRQGVVHGDLKPGNVILSKQPDGRPRAVVTDFGLARMADIESGSRGGTPEYMAPELILGEPATVASDLYALGVLFHTMLTGRVPKQVAWPEGSPVRDPESHETTRTIAVVQESDWRREIEPLPAPWKAIVSNCLSARPQDRPASAEAVASALQPRRWFLKAAAAAIGAAALVIAGREWKSHAPIAPVRLAVLPFEGDRVDAIAGIGIEVAERMNGARRNFTVISPREAERNQATTPERARVALGATHALQTRIRADSSIRADASLIDLSSGRAIQELHGTYAASDTQLLAKALIGTLTEMFHLAPAKETVGAAAYPCYSQGIELLRRDGGAADQAVPLFQKAIEIDPRSALPYAGLAEAYIQRQEAGNSSRLELAEAAVSKASSINPDSVPVLLAAGFVQQERGRYEPAVQLLKRATELAPDDAETWRRLALCYERANRPDDAVATYQKAIEAQPEYYRHYLSFGTFYLTRGQFERAEEQYRRVVAIAPELAPGRMNLGLALMQEGKFLQAETELLHALQLRRSAGLLLNLGALYYAQERFEEAAKYFEQSLDGAPSTVAYRDLGDAYRHLGRTKDARPAYEQARKLTQAEIARNPKRAASHSLLGLLDALLGDRENATFELAQAISADPENRSVIRDSAIAYEFMGRRESAIAALKPASKSLLEEANRNPDLKQLRQDQRFQQLFSNSAVQ